MKGESESDSNTDSTMPDTEEVAYPVDSGTAIERRESQLDHSPVNESTSDGGHSPMTSNGGSFLGRCNPPFSYNASFGDPISGGSVMAPSGHGNVMAANNHMAPYHMMHSTGAYHSFANHNSQRDVHQIASGLSSHPYSSPNYYYPNLHNRWPESSSVPSINGSQVYYPRTGVEHSDLAAYHTRQPDVASNLSGVTNLNNSTRTSTNNSSSSTNNGSPIGSEQPIDLGNSHHHQPSSSNSHGHLGNGDHIPNAETNHSPPLKSAISSLDMLAHHPGHSMFPTYNVPNGQQMHHNINMQPGKKGKSRGRGRKPPNPSPSPEQSFDRVFIWDLDETLILYSSLLHGGYCTNYYKGEGIPKARELGTHMESLINRLGDSYFFYDELDDIDQSHVDDAAGDDNGQNLSEYDFRGDGFYDAQAKSNQPMIARGGVDWMRKLAYRYRRIKELYNQYRCNVGELLADNKGDLEATLKDINEFTSNWCVYGRRCVEITSNREKCANVLVSPLPLIPTICKVLLYGLGPYFEIDNIYSAFKVGHSNIFQKLTNKYGKKCTFVVIGDGADEQQAASNLEMPFWRVSSHHDLMNLERALVDFHM